jgi:hypothetical protein
VNRFLPTVRVWLVLAAFATAAAFVVSYHTVKQNQISIAGVAHTHRGLSALIALEGAIGDVIFSSSDDAVDRTSATAIKRVDDLAALTIDNE